MILGYVDLIPGNALARIATRRLTYIVWNILYVNAP